jgi:hypothetical protein
MTEATDAVFDDVIAEAKSEGNLSRMNVVRKVREKTAVPEGRSWEKTAAKVRALAEQSYSSRQIAKQIGMSEEYVRRTAREFKIEITADKVIGKTRRHDPNRIARETVDSLAGLAMGVELIDDDASFDPEEAAHWSASLKESFRALNRFHDKIRKAHQ